MLWYVVQARILDGLQHRGILVLVCQGFDHSTGLDLWHTAMVVVFLYLGHISSTVLGFLSQSSAHADRIQYHLDLYISVLSCKTSGINTDMKTYLVAKAHCAETDQTVKSQNLSGRYEHYQRRECLQEAEYLAQQMQYKTGRFWRGFVEQYQLEGNVNKL
jgi:hypothetical protein